MYIRICFCICYLYRSQRIKACFFIQEERMSTPRFLDFYFGNPRKFTPKATQMRSLKEKQNSGVERQNSGRPKIFQPNSEEMKRVFDKFDTNRDGKISREEYKLALKLISGKNCSSTELARAFQAIDSDQDGFIDFEEFMKVQNMDGGINGSDIQSAFRVFDLNGDGRISAEELLAVMRRLGERCGLESCRQMVRGVDADGDGLINMDEFMNMMVKTMKSS